MAEIREELLGLRETFPDIQKYLTPDGEYLKLHNEELYISDYSDLARGIYDRFFNFENLTNIINFLVDDKDYTFKFLNNNIQVSYKDFNIQLSLSVIYNHIIGLILRDENYAANTIDYLEKVVKKLCRKVKETSDLYEKGVA